MENNSYDNIAEEYRDSKKLSFRKHIEEYTLFQLAQNVEGLTIIDLACGEGIYTRKLKAHGAAEIIGVDLSSAMIALAEESERQESMGCKYLVHDVLTLDATNTYNIVIGMYLLNYATSKEELEQFCQVAYDHLKPGGRFIGFNDNPMNDPAYYGTYEKYGFIKESPPNRKEGDYVKYIIINPDGTVFHFNNFYLHPDTYAAAFKKAGFKSFNWEGPFLNPEEQAPERMSAWEDFMNQPPMMGFTAVK